MDDLGFLCDLTWKRSYLSRLHKSQVFLQTVKVKTREERARFYKLKKNQNQTKPPKKPQTQKTEYYLSYASFHFLLLLL